MENDIFKEFKESSFLSNPFENDWIFELKCCKKKVALVGNGVVAAELKIILKKSQIRYKNINPRTIFKKKPAKDTLYILSSPLLLNTLLEWAKKNKLAENSGYLNYKKIVRNRIVLDLRNGKPANDHEKLARVLDDVAKIQTICGIDVYARKVNALRNASKYLKRLDIHKKAVLFCGRKSCDDLKLVGLNYDVVEVQAASLLLKHQLKLAKRINYYNRILRVQMYGLFKKTKNNTQIFKRYPESVFHEKNFPEYYNKMLFSRNPETKLPSDLKIKPGMFCLSRRMFPIFNNRLEPQLCSLYRGTDGSSYKNFYQKEFIGDRAKLCSQCIEKKLHRLC